ncbi:MAG TPA: hypothetical protein VKU82_10760, partial [Planctomycetaceae bacterium]|nr:hypothetical protein [Planctomycetaceae bacterium]
MRRRSNSHSPISLFPFLDTLVCTMGSLILMLLAMTPKIKERALARELARRAEETRPTEIAPEPEPPAEPAVPVAAPGPDLAQLAAERAAEGQKRRQAWLQSLADARERLSARQAELRRQKLLLKEALCQLKDVDDQLLKTRLKGESAGDARQSLAEAEEKIKARQEAIAQKIAQTRKNIDVLNRKQADRPNEYALVPYDGSSGTVRRPVYIECSGKGYRFLSEDESISARDLDDFPERYNPLLTGTQALLRYWARRRRESPETEPEPYILLLVRPSGVDTYYQARSMLAPLGANFGYELVDEDFKISAPTSDPVAKSVVRDAIEIAFDDRGKIGPSLVDARAGGPGGPSRNQRPGGSLADDMADDSPAIPYGAGGGSRKQPSIHLGPRTRAYRDRSGTRLPGDGLNDSSGTTGAGSATARPTGSTEKSLADTGARGTAKSGAGQSTTMNEDFKVGGASTQTSDASNSSAFDFRTGTSSQSGRATASTAGSGRSAPRARGAQVAGAATHGAGGSGPIGNFGAGNISGDNFGLGAPNGAPRDLNGAFDGKKGDRPGLGTDGEPDFFSADSLSNTGGAPGSAIGAGKGVASGNRKGGRGAGSSARPAAMSGSPFGTAGGDGSGDGDEPLGLPVDLDAGGFRSASGKGSEPGDSIPFLPADGDRSMGTNHFAGAGADSSSGGGPSEGSSRARSRSNTGRSKGSPSSGSPSTSAGSWDETGDGGASSGDPSNGSSSPGGAPSPVQMGGPGVNLRL